MYSLFVSLYLSNLAISDSTHSTIPIHSSCNNIVRNGLHYIKPSSTGSVIPVICNNGYTMLDLSLDYNLRSYPSYLTSHSYASFSKDWVLPSLDDVSTFKQWWTPSASDDSVKFRIAKDCESCESSIDFGDNVVYYGDAHLFGCAATQLPGCTLNVNEHACNICDHGDIDYADPTSRTWLVCYAIQMKSDTPIDTDHDHCITHDFLYKPVMATDRTACTCYQPSTSNIYHVSHDELPSVTITEAEQKRIAYIDDLIVFGDKDSAHFDGCNEKIFYLKNSDFLSGTYRIKDCGEYILTEDIILHFNPPKDIDINTDTFSPNSIDVDDLYWFPTQKQSESGLYKGTYSYIGSYSLGFFAGITVEAHNVKINLNGYTLSMDPLFYFQQRYFTLIECGAKYFLSYQGPSHWDMNEEFYANHLEIFGGTLGLSSHHGIHGLRVSNLNIHDVNVHSFDVAGIVCNGCNDVIIESVSVGALNTNIPVLGRYTHARAMLPRLKQFADEYGSEYITFYNRNPMTISSLIDRLILQMDMMYHHYMNGIAYDADDVDWIGAKKLFLNPSGWMDGGSSYGIVLNGDGAAVNGIGARHDGTSNIVLNNVEIFGIYNAVLEKMRTCPGIGTIRGIMSDTVDWIAVTDSTEDGGKAQYVGDAFTDIVFAVRKYETSWLFLNSLWIEDTALQYAFEGMTRVYTDDDAEGCGSDIQLHSVKGAIGLSVDGVQNIAINDLYIHDVVNWADLGGNWCGEYERASVGGEDIDIQYGYTGTRAHGLMMVYASGSVENVKISNIESLNGEAIGLIVYKECDIEISHIGVHKVEAGTQLTVDDVDGLRLPNLIPNACAVQIYDNTQCRASDITQSGVVGYSYCDDHQDLIPSSSDVMLSSQLQRINNDFNSIAVVFLILSVVFIAVFFGIVHDQQNKGTKIGRILSEHTPLLV